MSINNAYKNNGFSLVELSIVLVIIGLVTGGVLIGQNLIQAGKLQSVSSEMQKIHGAVSTFQDKHYSLPGDMSRASAFWPTTTNGDGDGQIDYNLGGPGEEYFAWQHLANEGLVEGQYTGAPQSLPAGVIASSYFRLSNQTDVYDISGLMISFNRMGVGYARHAVLTPQEAHSIDAKMDDGNADSGKILGFNEQGVGGCATSDYSASTADYILTNDDILCKLFYVVE